LKIEGQSFSILLRREPGNGRISRFTDRASYLLLTPFRHRAVRSRLLRGKYLMARGTTDFFDDVTIETSATCNRRCSYCPNSLVEQSRSNRSLRLPTSLYESIVDQLAEIKFDGRISPHGFGEPLLDERLPTLISYARRKLPRCRIWVFTNGDLLKPSLYKTLVQAGVSRFVVTQHDPQMSRSMRQFFSYVRAGNGHGADILYQGFEKGVTPLSNRGGLLDPGINLQPRCGDPDNPLTITAEGHVVLCANDYFGTVRFGNVAERPLLDIWREPAFRETRRQLRERRYSLPICLRCTGQASLANEVGTR
jgi:MoaA/NifB/PqqE/SkfB family radical SAM enzyme